jgi:hypothetical protein
MNTVYDTFIASKKIHPIKISSYEIGWHLKDVNDVLQWLSDNNKIVLGGDIIDSKKTIHMTIGFIITIACCRLWKMLRQVLLRRRITPLII